MIFSQRAPFPLALVAALLGAALLAACTAQESPPVGGGKPSGDPQAGGAEEKPAEPDAPKDRVAALLADPNLVPKGKLGRSLAQTRCTMCHKVDGKGGVLSPPLEQVTAERFTKMKDYSAYLAELKGKDPARFNASKKIFDEIEADTNPDRRVLRWLDAYLAKPTFDNGQAKMLKQVLTAEQVDQLLAYMLTLGPKPDEAEKKPATE